MGGGLAGPDGFDTVTIATTLDDEHWVLFLNFSGFCTECMTLDDLKEIKECEHVVEARMYQECTCKATWDVKEGVLRGEKKQRLLDIWMQEKSPLDRYLDIVEFLSDLIDD